jgi:hypothetical protein
MFVLLWLRFSGEIARLDVLKDDDLIAFDEVLSRFMLKVFPLPGNLALERVAK